MRMKLEDVLSRLKADIRKKKTTLKLDLETMSLKAVNDVQGVDMSKAHISRDHWDKGNDNVLRESTTVRYEAARIIKKSSTIKEERKVIHQQCSVDVVEACGVHAEKVKAISKEIEIKLIKSRDELQKAKVSAKHLEREIASKEAPLKLARQRLAHREKRPPEETVRDLAEEKLVEEVNTHMDGLQDMKNRLILTNCIVNDLTMVKNDIKEELASKNGACDTDDECVRLQAIIQGGPPFDLGEDDASLVKEGGQGTTTTSRPVTSSGREKSRSRVTPRPPTGGSRALGATGRIDLGATGRSGLGQTQRSLGTTQALAESQAAINRMRHVKPPSTARSARPAAAYESDLGATQRSLTKPHGSRPGTSRPGTGMRMTPRSQHNIGELSRIHTPVERPQTSRVHHENRPKKTKAFNSNDLQKWRAKRNDGAEDLAIVREMKRWGPLSTRDAPHLSKVSRGRVLASGNGRKPVSRGPWNAQAPLAVFD